MKRLSHYHFATIITFFFIILFTEARAHFEFTPIISTLSTTGKGSHTIAQVINRSDESVAIAIKATGRTLLESGVEERPETNDVVVFPNQFLLAPKETKLVKISWQGPNKVESEQAYRVIVEELPVDFSASSSNKSSVRIMVNYVGALYVSSGPIASDLKLENVAISNNDKKHISFLFNNSGSAHTILKAPQIEITASGKGDLPEKKVVLEKAQIELIEGKNILAKSKLRVDVPMPKSLNGYDHFEWNFKYEN
jgi:fimbrial chaperone protein